MSDFTITKEHPVHASTEVDNAFITDFLPSLPGDAVKVYLYGLMLSSSPDENSADIETALGLSPEAVLEAYRVLNKQGLVRIIDSGSVHIQYLNICGTGATEPSSSGRYADLVKKLQEVLGTRNLSGGELQKIYDWVDIFRFEPDAAVEIVRHSIEIKGSRVNINYMDAIAKRLAAERYLSYEQVHECFTIELESMTGAAAILKRWRISRRPTEDESELYRKWTKDWGFSDEAIDLACREVVSSDRPTFKYLDAILESYHDSGSVTAEMVQQLSHEQDLIAELTHQILVRAGLASRRSTIEQRQQVELWYKQWCMDPELMYYAAELSSSSGRPFSELKKLMNTWHDNGIGTVSGAKDFMSKQTAPTGSNQRKKTNRALSYRQHTYSADQLAELGIDFGEDVYED